MYGRFLSVSFLAIGCACSLILSLLPGPEKRIEGSWREVGWQYERSDDVEQRRRSWITSIDELVQLEMNGSGIVHKAERWNFTSDYNLVFLTSDTTETASWRLKGRGDVLYIRHQDGITEEYRIKQLSDDELVLYFYPDLQVRGIVKIVFEKI